MERFLSNIACYSANISILRNKCLRFDRNVLLLDSKRSTTKLFTNNQKTFELNATVEKFALLAIDDLQPISVE